MATTIEPMMIAGTDRYGAYLMIDDFRCAMPSLDIATRLAASEAVLDALQHACDVFGPINDSVGGKGALMQARAAIAKARGEF